MELETIFNVCSTDVSVSYWTQFTYSTFLWLTRSPVASLMIGGAFVLSFLILSGLLMRGFVLLKRGRKLKKLWLWGFPVAFLISISPLIIGEPLLTTFLPRYDGQTADAVVILGRGRWLYANRVEEAAELIMEKAAPLVFVSGRVDAPVIARKLMEAGVSPSQIAGENCSGTTEENAQYTAQQLLPMGARSIILVSDPTHLLRSQLVFRSFGFDVIPYASPLPHEIGRRYRRLLAFRESLGFVTYGLMGRYLPRSIPDVNTTAAQ